MAQNASTHADSVTAFGKTIDEGDRLKIRPGSRTNELVATDTVVQSDAGPMVQLVDSRQAPPFQVATVYMMSEEIEDAIRQGACLYTDSPNRKAGEYKKHECKIARFTTHDGDSVGERLPTTIGPATLGDVKIADEPMHLSFVEYDEALTGTTYKLYHTPKKGEGVLEKHSENEPHETMLKLGGSDVRELGRDGTLLELVSELKAHLNAD